MTARHYVYLLECADGTLYCGYTTDLTRRVVEHNTGTLRGAKYTRARRPVSLRYQESYDTRVQAQQREAAIKKMSRLEKLALIATAGAM